MSHEIKKEAHKKNSVFLSVEAFTVTNTAAYIVWAGFLPSGDGVGVGNGGGGGWMPSDCCNSV